MTVEFNPKMKIIADMVDCLYGLPGCDGGGICHIVTDDFNLEDEHLNYVIDCCNDKNYNGIDKELGKVICELLLQLSLEQRGILFDMMGKREDITEKGWTQHIEKYHLQ